LDSQVPEKWRCDEQILKSPYSLHQKLSSPKGGNTFCNGGRAGGGKAPEGGKPENKICWRKTNIEKERGDGAPVTLTVCGRNPYGGISSRPYGVYQLIKGAEGRTEKTAGKHRRSGEERKGKEQRTFAEADKDHTSCSY